MPDKLYRRYLLGVLLVIQAFNGVDGLTLGLVLQNIKSDLHLTDTQLGFLSGIAFALFYGVMGIPIARWADRGNRVTIIALTTALWSVAVALCGAVSSFMQLLVIRIFVAVGEAGCIPPGQSLIADYFTRGQRPRAIGIYMLAGSMSVVIGYFAAGWLNQLYGWRATFVMVGAPGVALAVLARFTLREPRLEKGRPASTDPRIVQPSLKEVCTTLWASVTFRHLLICFSLFYFFSYGIQQWQPAFFIRSYGLKTGEVGNWFAFAYGLASFVGIYWGGVLASRYAANNERLQLRVLTVMSCLFGLTTACVYIAPNYHLAFAMLGVATALGSAGQGPLFAMIQTLVPPRMRATATAIMFLVANLIGAGLGPLAAGILSDALRLLFGEDSLRYALLALCPGYLWASWHLWRASQTVTKDFKLVEDLEENDVCAQPRALQEI
jgi:MFS transporter, Spinster family, sphingosine-1-phosphate transporter